MTEEEIESDEMSAIHELWFDITEAPIEGVDAMMKYLNPIKMSADIIVTYLVNFHQLRDVSKEYETRICNVPSNTTLLLERVYTDLYDKPTNITEREIEYYY